MTTSQGETVREAEPALDPDLPIVDPHHHLWGVSRAVRQGRTLADPDLTGVERQNLRLPRYLLEDFRADVGDEHNVRATVFCQRHAMYRAGPANRWRRSGKPSSSTAWPL